MQNNYTHLHLLVDRSGSMLTKWSATAQAFNSYLQDQKKFDGRATLSLSTFNTELDRRLDFVDLKTVTGYDLTTTRPNGGTSLYDALCQEIDYLGLKLSAIPEPLRPEKILFTLFSDGEERDSNRFSLGQLRERIRVQRDVYSWNFSFLGCEFDAEGFARDVGVETRFCNNFALADLPKSLHKYSEATTSFRSSPSRSLDQSYSNVLRGTNDGTN
jgi:hypothetical protein